MRVETFFAGPVDLLPFEEEGARSAGKIRAALEACFLSMLIYPMPTGKEGGVTA